LQCIYVFAGRRAVSSEGGNDAVHEVEKVDAPSAIFVSGHHAVGLWGAKIDSGRLLR
jgi:hypothetical protein